MRNWRQSLRYNLQIDSGNAILILKFAFVAKNLFSHTGDSEHHFRFSILDKDGNLKSSCANFEVSNSNLLFNNFQTYYPSDIFAGYTIQWSDWTTIASDLSEFIGQNITIEVFAEDCILPDSSKIGQWITCFGYTYFVTSCQPLELKQKNCDAESQSRLIAPEGFVNYLWTNDKGEMLGNSQTLEIADPQEGAEYFCKMTSVLGCETTISAKIYNPSLTADFNTDFSCDSNIVQFYNASTTSNGTLLYYWNFGDENTSGHRDPKIAFDSSGFHSVTLNVTNSLSGCTKKITKEIESFSQLTIGYEGETTYCPGESTWLKGFGTSHYLWSNGSKNDSIEISAPGGNFWLIASSSDNKCSTDTIDFSVAEEPDWNFWIDGDTILCPGEASTLFANGAYKQIWNDGTDSTILSVSDSGIYSCIGENLRGCKKTDTVFVAIASIPGAYFTLSDTIVNSRNNEITATAVSLPGIDYLWDMGDGEDSLTGSAITHNYDYNYPGRIYTCKLQTTNEFGCINTTSDEVVVIPFVPNVFTPNGDDVNDVFMEGADLEIFDRYGKVLYKGIGGWDGDYNGQPADPDTYFYSVSYRYNGKKSHTLKGYITLIR